MKTEQDVVCQNLRDKFSVLVITQRKEEYAQTSALLDFEKDLQTVINLCEKLAKEGHFEITITDAVFDPPMNLRMNLGYIPFVNCDIHLRNVGKIGGALTKQGLSTSIIFGKKNYQLRISWD